MVGLFLSEVVFCVRFGPVQSWRWPAKLKPKLDLHFTNLQISTFQVPLFHFNGSPDVPGPVRLIRLELWICGFCIFTILQFYKFTNYANSDIHWTLRLSTAIPAWSCLISTIWLIEMQNFVSFDDMSTPFYTFQGDYKSNSIFAFSNLLICEIYDYTVFYRMGLQVGVFFTKSKGGGLTKFYKLWQFWHFGPLRLSLCDPLALFPPD